MSNSLVFRTDLNAPANTAAVYELLYTSIGQAIATYAPNEYFASLMNPIIIGAGLISFCGVVVPYAQIPTFWRSWMYWLDPFTQRSHRVVVRHFDPITEYGTARPWSDYAHTATFGQL
jgi:hypothetical protein